MSSKKQYLWGLNGVRILCALMVFLFHVKTNLFCEFHFFNEIVIQPFSWMTLFFILSGFVLFYSYEDKSLDSTDEIFSFIKKRFLTLYSGYIIINVFYYLLFIEQASTLDLKVFPLQILMLQSVGNYPYLANTGTWFFSCILYCYLVFPYVLKIAKSLSKKALVSSFGALILFLYTLSRVTAIFGNDYYSNSINRIIEFSFGIILCRVLVEFKILDILRRFNQTVLYLISLVIWVILFLGARRFILEGTGWKISFFTAICSIFIFTLSASNNSRISNKLNQTKLAIWASNSSLEFWVAQTITMQIGFRILRVYLPEFHKNIALIVGAFIVNVVITIALYWIRKLFMKKFTNVPIYKTICLASVIMLITFGIKLF